MSRQATASTTSTLSQTFGYEPANRLQNANGAWGAKTFYYDGVGNRIEERSTPVGGALTTDTYGYPATSNRLVQITRGAATVRTLAYDGAGSLTSDSGAAGNKTYVYNKRNRLSSATIGAIQWTYVYNGLEQLTTRTRVGASPADIAHYIHDIWGNIIAETDGGGATGATGTIREYIYLPEAEIAPTMSVRTVVDRPVAVVDAVNTATPVTWFVHVDHLNRPIKMTNAAKAVVWDAVWLPWGGVHSITGSATLDARFPGQWFQLETGLHYNWHRSYDPSIGRYTQADPLGFVDGPSVYGYARGGPQISVDRDGRQNSPPPPSGIPGGPWQWNSDPSNGRTGNWQGPGQGPDGGQNRSTASWDAPDGHWDVDDGHGNRQRYNRHGAPISPDEAHGRYKGPRRFPIPRWCIPLYLPPTILCDLVPNAPECRNL